MIKEFLTNNPVKTQPSVKNNESSELPEYLQSSPNRTRSHKRENKLPLMKSLNKSQEKEHHNRNYTFNLGNSFEAPTYFFTKNSVVDKQSYNNPYIHESIKWPILAKLNNKLTNSNEFQINAEPFKKEKTLGRSITIFKFDIYYNFSSEI